jgi:hypothetical protein
VTVVLRRRLFVGIILATCLTAWSWRPDTPDSVAALPAQLSDREYWALIEAVSEPEGQFRSENLVSNEDTFPDVLLALEARVPAGSVYLGVGPEQNFTYIAALRPRMAFIPDIRRGNLHLHLMYKALIELSADRADFLSRLFSRPRPDELVEESTADDLFHAYATVLPSRALYDESTRAIADHLIGRRGFRLSERDVAGISHVMYAFYRAGPDLAYSSMGRPGRSRYPTFRDLQTLRDRLGQNRGFLASEPQFAALKAFQEKNLLVPVVGDFAGPRALRAIGAYLKQHGATVGSFYTSNVEQYLFQSGRWPMFIRNVATLPLDESSTFIRSCFNNCRAPEGTRSVLLLDSMPLLVKDFGAGRVRSYRDVLDLSR